MDFSITALSVLTMLIYAVPGFIFIKRKKMKPESIPNFAVLLLYVCQPCQTIYTFMSVDYTPILFARILLFMVITFLIMGFMIGIFFIIFGKKGEKQVKYRIANIAVAFGNCAFMGVPLVSAVIPEYPEAKVYASIFAVGMNLLGWTVASAIITRNVKYIRIKKMLLNPSTIGLAIALPLFLLSVELPQLVTDMITLLGKMTTPLCMIIMGMRLGTVKLRELLCDRLQYITVAVKQIVMPLFALALIQIMPVEAGMEKTLYILCACPVASVVLNYAELLGEGQKNAANTVLLGTLTSIITIPIMMLFYVG